MNVVNQENIAIHNSCPNIYFFKCTNLLLTYNISSVLILFIMRNTLKYYGGKYFCKEDGTLWSKVGKLKCKRSSVGKDGYHRIMLSGEGKNTTCYLHRLVWEQFHGEIPSGMTVNHKDMDKGNNALDNLELMTQAENLAHARSLRKWDCGRSRVMLVRKRLMDRRWEKEVYEGYASAASSVNGGGANICNSVKSGKLSYGYLWKRVDS